jgi:hypothetical protein
MDSKALLLVLSVGIYIDDHLYMVSQLHTDQFNLRIGIEVGCSSLPRALIDSRI